MPIFDGNSQKVEVDTLTPSHVTAQLLSQYVSWSGGRVSSNPNNRQATIASVAAAATTVAGTTASAIGACNSRNYRTRFVFIAPAKSFIWGVCSGWQVSVFLEAHL